MDLYNRIFVYSGEQKKDKMKIAKDLGREYVPGYVIVKGRKRLFTDIVIDMSRFQYGDGQVVAQGDIRKISYTGAKGV